MIGGVNSFIQEIANRIVDAGHEVSIIAGKIVPEIYEFDSRVELISVADLQGKDIRFWMGVPYLVQKLGKAIRQTNPDVVVANHFPSHAAMLASGIPGVWMCQEPFPFFHKRSAMGKDPKTQALSLAVSLLFSKYDIKIARSIPLIAGNSSFTQSEIRRVFQRNCEIVFPGFDESLLTHKLVSKTPSTVLAGSPTTLLKGFEYTLRAFLALQKKGVAQELRVVGNLNPVYRNMIDSVLRKNPHARITVLGPVSRAVLLDEYKKASLLAYPSIEEPFGIMPLEAAALGTQVLYFNSGGLLETMKDGLTGHGVKVRDASAFQDTMESLLINPLTIDREAPHFRNHMSKFTWQNSASTLLRLCEQAVENQRSILRNIEI